MSDYVPYSARDSRHFIRDLPAEEQPLNRLHSAGPKALSNSELLAVMLQTADALDLAQEVLMLCDGLHNLARYDVHQLTAIRGIGPAQAARLVAISELGCRLVSPPYEAKRSITSPATAANLLLTEMRFKEQEEMVSILLNTRSIVIDMVTIYKGSLSTIVVRVADILRPALLTNAQAFILAHNHPSGDPEPSPEDIAVTREIKKAGELLGVNLLDHIILGAGQFVSLKERGVGFE